jgi:hypothetical protein
MTTKIQLEPVDALNHSVEELSKTILVRFGLLPRKKDGNAAINKLLLELYERKKVANRDRQPERSVITVEEMGSIVGIKRQTMYEYLHRWLDLNLLKKTSFVSNGKVVIGYELNGNNIESAFRRAEFTIKNHLESSFRLIDTLQNEIKKEKLKTSNTSSENQPQQHSSLPEAHETDDQAEQKPQSPHTF